MQIKMLERIQPHDNTSIDYACNTLAIVSAEKLCVPRLDPLARSPDYVQAPLLLKRGYALLKVMITNVLGVNACVNGKGTE
jgi:hypothetical protein